MNRIDYTQPGGFPLDQDVLNFMQGNIFLAAQAAALGGQNCILSGCEVVGGNVSNGYVVIAGEILPFVGSPKDEKVVIVEQAEDLNYEDGVSRPAQLTRYATCGDDGVTNILFDSLERNTAEGVLARIRRLEGLHLPGDIKEIDVTAAYIAANFDATGLGINERAGWAICNGNNGTRNRNGRVPVQYDPNNVKFNTPGNTGGAETHTLTNNQLPRHRFQVSGVGGSDDYGMGNDFEKSGGGGSTFYRTNVYTGYIGNDDPHNNLQPYIVTLFIQKL